MISVEITNTSCISVGFLVLGRIKSTKCPGCGNKQSLYLFQCNFPIHYNTIILVQHRAQRKLLFALCMPILVNKKEKKNTCQMKQGTCDGQRPT